MPRRAYPSASLAAAVRAHFGLTQAELAAFVSVSRPGLAGAEAGRKPLGPGPDQRLQVLARQLPPPDGLGPPAPAFAAARAVMAGRLARFRRRTQLPYQTEQQRQPGQARHRRRLWACRYWGRRWPLRCPCPTG